MRSAGNIPIFVEVTLFSEPSSLEVWSDMKLLDPLPLCTKKLLDGRRVDELEVITDGDERQATSKPIAHQPNGFFFDHVLRYEIEFCTQFLQFSEKTNKKTYRFNENDLHLIEICVTEKKYNAWVYDPEVALS